MKSVYGNQAQLDRTVTRPKSGIRRAVGARACACARDALDESLPRQPAHKLHSSPFPRLRHVFDMSRQRRKPDRLASGLDSLQPPTNRPSVPLSLHEPVPSTLLGRLYFHLHELLQLARHILYCLIFGVGYDLTPAERELSQQAQQRQQLQQYHREQEQDMVLQGYIRNTYQLRRRPGSPSVTLCGDVVAGEQDPFAHAVTAYAHCGLDPTAEFTKSRIVAYTGPSAVTTLPSYEPYAFPTFERPPYGSLQAFLLTAPSYPSLYDLAIPHHAAQSALPFHWLLNLASAVSFLHSHGVAHQALALNLLWLRADFSAALFDLTCSVFAAYDDEWDEVVSVNGGLLGWGSFHFPIDDTDSTYYSGAMPENAIVLGKAIDVFDFGTVAWRLLTRTVEGAPGWTMPKRKIGEHQWSITELQQRLREAIDVARTGRGTGRGTGKGRYEPPGMEVVWKCWALEYQDGGEVLKALRRLVLETGLTVQKLDEVEGVTRAVEQFRKDYKPNSYLGNELISERGYI
jgi:hypothetical protein